MTNDTDKATTSPDDQFPPDESAIFSGRTETGKIARLSELLAAVSDHETKPEWIDPKGVADSGSED